MISSFRGLNNTEYTFGIGRVAHGTTNDIPVVGDYNGMIWLSLFPNSTYEDSRLRHFLLAEAATSETVYHLVSVRKKFSNMVPKAKSALDFWFIRLYSK